jgi:hypothetical protein
MPSTLPAHIDKQYIKALAIMRRALKGNVEELIRCAQPHNGALAGGRGAAAACVSSKQSQAETPRVKLELSKG